VKINTGLWHSAVNCRDEDNHKATFKSFMYAYLRDWQEREKELQSLTEIPDQGSQAAKKTTRS
jgi:hypothetical protein